MKPHPSFLLICLALGGLLALATPAPALAYGGPGSVISGIGALLAVVAAIGASILGFVWFPVKKLIRWLGRGRRREGAGQPDEEAPSL